MCVSPTATELGAGNGLAGPARHHFLPPQLAKALAPAAERLRGMKKHAEPSMADLWNKSG